MKAGTFALLLFCCSSCGPPNPSTGLQALHKEATWNKAREVYFHSTKAPARQYEVDGVKGEIVDVHVYPTPRPDLVVVTFGETYQNTTGWDVHVVLMKTSDVPAYPGNVYLCPNGFDFAVDWPDNDTLGIFYPAGYYPDNRNLKTGAVSKLPNFEYEKQTAGIKIKFIPADRPTMDAKGAAMSAREMRPKK